MKGTSETDIDIAVIGAGPAGLTAGIYAARAGLEVAVFEAQFAGGQMATTDLVENLPGLADAIGGMELADRMRAQAERFGARIETAEVTALAREGEAWKLATSAGEIRTLAVIVATGAKPRRLGVAGEDRFWGRGVSCCATCDGAFYKGKEVVVVGGGDAAVKEAHFLTRFASKITLVHRRDRLRATQALQDELAEHGDQIEMAWKTVVEEILGEEKVTGVRLRDLASGETRELACDGVFVFVGFEPQTAFLPAEVERDQRGYVLTNESMETDVPGLYACGDARKKLLRQIVTACGEGATAAFAAGHYVERLKGTAYE